MIKITEANREKKLSSPPCSPTDSAVLGLSNAEKLDPMRFLLGITNTAARVLCLFVTSHQHTASVDDVEIILPMQ